MFLDDLKFILFAFSFFCQAIVAQEAQSVISNLSLTRYRDLEILPKLKKPVTVSSFHQTLTNQMMTMLHSKSTVYFKTGLPPKSVYGNRSLPANDYRKANKRNDCGGKYTQTCRGVGSNAVQGWVDLAKLVSGGGGFKSAYKDLAQNIGSDVYIDINGWHLFLRDISIGSDLKMHQALAQQIGEEKASGTLNLEELLKKVPIKIGGGKVQVSLYEAIADYSLQDLKKLVETYEG